MSEPTEPQRTVEVAGATVTLLGTAHVSRASAEHVRELIEGGGYDAVALELCRGRYRNIVEPERGLELDLFRVVREGKAGVAFAGLALGAFQERIAEQLGTEPGAEMKAAAGAARARGLPLLLIDRDVGVTFKRIYRSVPWWRRAWLMAGLAASLVSSERVTEAQIEGLKQGDVLESTFAQFATEQRDLYRPLVAERDRYMAARLRQEAARHRGRHLLAVVGAGHVEGMARHLEQDRDDPGRVIAELDATPPGSRWVRYLPWVVVAVVLAGFAIGFSRSPELGMSLVLTWVLINGGLSAGGAAIAGGHPVTVAGAFAAAPLTSLNPTVGAGMVTAAIEAVLRRPTMGDFARLRKDTVHLKGWWHNRVARTLLVFVLSTLGSAAGTYIAGFRIVERLATG